MLYVGRDEYWRLLDDGEWPTGVKFVHSGWYSSLWLIAKSHPHYEKITKQLASPAARVRALQDEHAYEAAILEQFYKLPFVEPKHRVYLFLADRELASKIGARFEWFRGLWYVPRSHPKLRELKRRFQSKKARAEWLRLRKRNRRRQEAIERNAILAGEHGLLRSARFVRKRGPKTDGRKTGKKAYDIYRQFVLDGTISPDWPKVDRIQLVTEELKRRRYDVTPSMVRKYIGTDIDRPFEELAAKKHGS
jgi:hypothetical protein